MNLKDVAVQTATLDLLTVVARERLSASMASRAEWSWLMDHVTDSMILELRSHVLANKVSSETVRLEAPRSPWQGKKAKVRDKPLLTGVADLLIAGWTRLFPVRSIVQEHTFEVYDAYPDAEMALPKNFGNKYRIATLS
jgi:hypothetical protein